MGYLFMETYMTLLSHFVKMCQNGDTLACVANCISLLLSVYSYCTWCI